MEKAELRSKTLEILRDHREEDNSMVGLDFIMKRLPDDIDPLRLYDWNHDAGILYELREEGLVDLIAQGEEPCAAAIGRMEWGE